MGLFLHSWWRKKILMTQKVTKDEKEILQDSEGKELPLPPYWMMVQPTNVAMASGASSPGVNRRPEGLPDSPALPTAPQVVEPPPWQAPTSVGETTEYSPPDLTTADVVTAGPKLYPLLRVSTTRQEGENTGIKQRLRSAKEPEEKMPLQMPLREVQQPPVQGEDAQKRGIKSIQRQKKWLRKMVPGDITNLE
ncbi:hypothetical protein Celaphus_00015089, partial [Cervus elaphus hippelaphus]